MSKTIFETAEIPAVIETLAGNSSVLCLRSAIGATCIAKLIQLNEEPGRATRAQQVLEVLGNEIPLILSGLSQVAQDLNANRRSVLRATEGLASPVIYRSARTPVHADTFEYKTGVRPFAFGPYSISIGITGAAVFRDYGPLLRGGILVDRLVEPTYVRDLCNALDSFIEFYESVPYKEVLQSPGDIVLIPCAPNVGVHEVAGVSDDRCAIVSGQLWYDSSSIDISTPGSLTDLTEVVYRTFKPSPVQ